MKIKFFLFIIASFAISTIYSQTTENEIIDVILSSASERGYTSEPVTDQQLDLILKSGIKAPSALNNQPWKFTVIKDEAIMKNVINDAIPGNVLIVVSGLQAEDGSTPDFDCGLAAQNMYLAAHGIGLGARPYGSPTRILNRMKERYQIPEGYQAVIVLRIGNVDKSVDALSAASPRKPAEEVVNIYKSVE
ncbi:MAG: nitroreductase family protein [Prolixibacteraceae bacterium]|nr:nitroreductase family protein [Prolixibacteraceae bacterium]